MDKSKMMAILSIARGMTYAEWRLICEEIEHGFQMRLNREKLESEDAERIEARLEIELDAYFRR